MILIHPHKAKKPVWAAAYFSQLSLSQRSQQKHFWGISANRWCNRFGNKEHSVWVLTSCLTLYEMKPTWLKIYYWTLFKWKCGHAERALTWAPRAKRTFCEFEQEPGVYCSKAAVSLSYSLTNLERVKKYVEAEDRSEGCADNTASPSLLLFSILLLTL